MLPPSAAPASLRRETPEVRNATSSFAAANPPTPISAPSKAAAGKVSYAIRGVVSATYHSASPVVYWFSVERNSPSSVNSMNSSVRPIHTVSVPAIAARPM